MELKRVTELAAEMIDLALHNGNGLQKIFDNDER